MKIVGIDPGPGSEHHAFVLWDTETDQIQKATAVDCEGAVTVMETMSPIGAILAKTTIDTIFESGRLFENLTSAGFDVRVMTRRDVKREIIGSVSGKDRDVSNALIERFGDKGTKKAPGKLFGISGHHLAALAVAVAFYDRCQRLGGLEAAS